MQFSSTEKLRTLNPGEVINDQSTYANHGVVNTTLRLVNLPGCKDVVGLHFPDGKDSKGITVKNSPSLNMIDGQFTIELWIKTDDIFSGYVILKRGNYGYPKYQGGSYLNYYMQSNTVRSTQSICDTSLHYFALVCISNVDCSFYIDGQYSFKHTVGYIAYAIAAPLLIGDSDGWNSAGGNYRGTIFCIRISKIARPGNEIAQAFEAFKPK